MLTNSFTVLLPCLFGNLKDGRLLYIVDDVPRGHHYKSPPPPRPSPPPPPPPRP